MAFLPGLKKQINKANQFMSEKISGVEGTKAGSSGFRLILLKLHFLTAVDMVLIISAFDWNFKGASV
jgi:hypothetical protein